MPFRTDGHHCEPEPLTEEEEDALLPDELLPELDEAGMLLLALALLEGAAPPVCTLHCLGRLDIL